MGLPMPTVRAGGTPCVFMPRGVATVSQNGRRYARSERLVVWCCGRAARLPSVRWQVWNGEQAGPANLLQEIRQAI